MMRTLHFIALATAFLITAVAQAAAPTASVPPQHDLSLIEVPASPAKGFNYPYELFIPKPVQGGLASYLLVEPNNTGHPDDDLEVHRAAAISLARDSSVGNFVSVRLGIPLLVPVFPRPSRLADVYTHSLDRDTILISDGPMKRLDLQLLSMVADARERLAAMGHPVNQKFLLNGFSASGLFANRFTLLHPDTVAAAAFGGVNGFIMLPVAEIDSHSLEFPLGLADFAKITGHPFKRAAYDAVPQFAYMGANYPRGGAAHALRPRGRRVHRCEYRRVYSDCELHRRGIDSLFCSLRPSRNARCSMTLKV